MFLSNNHFSSKVGFSFITITFFLLCSLLLTSQVSLAVSGTFTATQTVANDTAGSDNTQAATYATTQANVTAGNDTQTFTLANVTANDSVVGSDTNQDLVDLDTTANVTAATATITVDSDIVVTADAVGAGGNAFSIQIAQSDADLGASTDATIAITKTGSAILVTVQHNSNIDADGASSTINVTRASIVAALNMSASGETQDGLVAVTITDNVSGDITATGGSTTKVGTIGATSLAGGLNAVAQVTTFTPSVPEVGDIFTIDINGTLYAFTATSTVIADITAGLTILADAHSAVTCTDDATKVTCTATTAGTAFTTTGTAATNKAAVKQVDDITPANVESGDSFTVTGVATSPVTVMATSDSVATLVNDLVTAINGASGSVVDATNASSKLRLTADVAGTGFTATPSTQNRSAVTQTNTITITGVVDVGDVYTAELPGSVTATYTAVADDTTSTVATGLNTAIQASTGYASQAFTSGVATNVITLTAKAAGTGYTVTSDADNKAAVAQVVTFTPADVNAGETFRATINGGSNLDYTVVGSKTVKDVVEGIVTAMNNEPAVACSEDDTKVTCTADSAGTSFTFSATVVDITAPTVTITDDESGTANIAGGDITYTFTFSESVTGFVTGDVTVVGGTKGTFSGSGASYTLVVTPNASSTTNITVDVAGSVADDAVGNDNTAATQSVQAVDTISPAITSITSDATASGRLKIGDTILFTLTPTLTEAGATVTGSYNGVSLVWSTANGGVTYTATYTVASGNTDRATAHQISGVTITDTAGNVSSSASGSDIVKTIDANVPTLSSAETISTTTIYVAFSEDLDGTTISNADFSVVGNTLTLPDAAEVTDGVVRLSLATPIATDATPNVSYVGSIKDLAGNTAPTAGPITPTDNIDPTIVITDDESGTANIAGGDITYTFTFSESVTGFVTGDVTVVGGTKGTFSGSGASYTLAVTPDSNSTTSITVDVAGGVALDSASNSNIVAVQSVQVVDTKAPSVTITDDELGTANISGGSVLYTFTFSEAVTGFDDADVDVVGGTEGTFSANSSTEYTLEVTPTPNSTTSITVDIDAGMADDGVGNDNTAATQSVQIVDTIAPTLVITDDESGIANITGGNVVYTFTFTESVTGFTADDVTVVGGTKGSLSGSGAVYTLPVTPASNSTTTITVDVTSGVAVDTASNPNTAATQSTQQVDTKQPSVVITDDESGVANVSGGDITYTFTFSESVTGFVTGDVTVVGGTKGTFSGSGASYTLVVTPASNSTTSITVDVAGGVATSTNGNESTAATQSVQIVDTKTPTLSSVTVSSNNASTTLAKVGNVITLSFTGSENLSTPTATIRGNVATVSGSGSTWTATYTMQSGDTEGVIPFAINFSDTNANTGTQVTALTSGSNVTFDKTAPSITLVGEDYVTISRFAEYVDAGATATDTRDGTITGSIATSSTVDTQYVGKYSVTYSVSDSAGNSATQVTRTVKVNSGSNGGGGSSVSNESTSVAVSESVPSQTPLTSESISVITEQLMAITQNFPTIDPSNPNAEAIAQIKVQVVSLLQQLVLQLQAQLNQAQ